MFFGKKDVDQRPTAGTPPPVLRFSAFGEKQFHNIPVVLESFSTTYDSNVDLKSLSLDELNQMIEYASRQANIENDAYVILDEAQNTSQEQQMPRNAKQDF